MNNIAIYNYYKQYNNNDALFKPERYMIGDNLGYPFICLQKEFRNRGIELHTVDMFNGENIDASIFIDHCTGYEQQISELKNKYLIIAENPMIKPDNYTKETLDLYDKVFTWYDDLIDNKKIFKYYQGNKIPDYAITNKKSRLSCLIASNKYSDNKDEKYSSRRDIINYFNKFYPNDFDLYGYGWNESNVYKGSVRYKFNTYLEYKFVFCMENAIYNGYVTEKIFDALFSGCVPIYFETKELPDNIYIKIDKTDLYSMDNLYKKIKEMPEDEYMNYLKNISDYVLSNDIKKYSGEYFAKTIAEEILK